MLQACYIDNNVALWHDTSPAYRYSYDNWQLQTGSDVSRPLCDEQNGVNPL